MSPAELRSRQHSPELDGIRGLAILGVLCSHGAGLTGIFDSSRHVLPDTIVKYALVPLWGGVDLFFALSGFLITGILLRTKTAENYFSSFYARRVLRIFPIYYFVLTMSLVMGHFSAQFAAQLPQWTSWKIAYFAYLQNWPVFWHGDKAMTGQWGLYWSLAVEEQFYFVWPLLIMLFKEETMTAICCIGFVSALPLRIFLSYRYFGVDFGLAQLTSSRVDGLFLGAACAIYMFRHKRPVPMRWICAAAACGTLILAYIAVFHSTELISTRNWMTTLGITGFALLAGSLVAVSQHRVGFIDRILTLRWLQTVGKYSYGMYVYQLFIFIPLRYLGHRRGLWAHLNFPEQVACLLLEEALVFVVAKISYDAYESRFLRLKSFFKPKYALVMNTAQLPR
jgi:peptidoglycan/LPS O-acetylase OafA/YrhL